MIFLPFHKDILFIIFFLLVPALGAISLFTVFRLSKKSDLALSSIFLLLLFVATAVRPNIISDDSISYQYYLDNVSLFFLKPDSFNSEVRIESTYLVFLYAYGGLFSVVKYIPVINEVFFLILLCFSSCRFKSYLYAFFSLCTFFVFGLNTWRSSISTIGIIIFSLNFSGFSSKKAFMAFHTLKQRAILLFTFFLSSMHYPTFALLLLILIFTFLLSRNLLKFNYRISAYQLTILVIALLAFVGLFYLLSLSFSDNFQYYSSYFLDPNYQPESGNANRGLSSILFVVTIMFALFICGLNHNSVFTLLFKDNFIKVIFCLLCLTAFLISAFGLVVFSRLSISLFLIFCSRACFIFSSDCYELIPNARKFLILLSLPLFPYYLYNASNLGQLLLPLF